MCFVVGGACVLCAACVLLCRRRRYAEMVEEAEEDEKTKRAVELGEQTAPAAEVVPDRATDINYLD